MLLFSAQTLQGHYTCRNSVSHADERTDSGKPSRLHRITTGTHTNPCNIFYVLLTAASRYNHVKKNQLDAQLIHSIFCQPLHVSGVSRPIIRRHNRWYLLFFFDDCLLSWFQSIPDNRQSSKRRNKYQLLYT
jgi:hypothetical protein